MDYHITALGVEKAGAQQVIHESLEATLAGAIDAGIVLGNLITAAESLGLGAVPIGGIRNDPAAMIELLQLPPRTFPLAGLCLGYGREEGRVKPRLPVTSFRHDEVYHDADLRQSIDDYDKTLMAHWKEIARGSGEPWSSSVASFYRRIYFPKVKPVLERQSFLNDK